MIKKSTIVLLLTVFFVSVKAQEKKDTVIVPIFEKYDTIPALVLYPGKDNSVKYVFGFLVRKGYAKINDDKKSMSWVQQPDNFSILDDKKKPIINALKIFY